MAVLIPPALAEADLSLLPLASLQGLARKLGVRGTTRMRKSELVQAVTDRLGDIAAAPTEAGADGMPDPRAARTEADLMAVLRRYRIWAGDPSFREMERRLFRSNGPAGRVPASTLCAAINRDRLPRLEMFSAVISACGADEHDRDLFVGVWRQVKMRSAASRGYTVRPADLKRAGRSGPCANCGAGLDPGDVFCGNCGAAA